MGRFFGTEFGFADPRIIETFVCFLFLDGEGLEEIFDTVTVFSVSLSESTKHIYRN